MKVSIKSYNAISISLSKSSSLKDTTLSQADKIGDRSIPEVLYLKIQFLYKSHSYCILDNKT